MSKNNSNDLDPNYTEVNREMWNQTADIHKDYTFAKTLEKVAEADFSCLDEIETSLLKDIGVVGKDVAQLSCNNGREIISVKKMGAANCVGFDISDAFIAQAQELTKASGEEVNFVRTDVYELNHWCIWLDCRYSSLLSSDCSVATSRRQSLDLRNASYA